MTGCVHQMMCQLLATLICLLRFVCICCDINLSQLRIITLLHYLNRHTAVLHSFVDSVCTLVVLLTIKRFFTATKRV